MYYFFQFCHNFTSKCIKFIFYVVIQAFTGLISRQNYSRTVSGIMFTFTCSLLSIVCIYGPWSLTSFVVLDCLLNLVKQLFPMYRSKGKRNSLEC
jgi:hypothetical protein